MERPFINSIRIGVAAIALGVCCSAASAPNVVEEPAWVAKEPVFVGTQYTIHSDILGDDRSFLIALPHGYESTTLRYPVLYVLDAEYFFHPANAALRFLSETGYVTNRPVPQMILVAVLDGDRNRDFTPTHAPVQGPLRFPTSGGADAYLEHVAISPSLWWNDQEPLGWARNRIADGAEFRQRLVITQGTLEQRGDIGRAVRSGIVALLEQKKAQGWAYVEIPGVGHNDTPYRALYDGLQAAFPGFAVSGEDMEEGLAAVKAHYAELSAAYGYAVNVPDDVYKALVQGWYDSHEPAEILAVTAEWTSTYPWSAIAWYYHGQMHRRSNDVDKARECFENVVALEQGRVLPDSEWLNPMRERLAKSTAQAGS